MRLVLTPFRITTYINCNRKASTKSSIRVILTTEFISWPTPSGRQQHPREYGMASIPGGQFTFFAANKPVNVVFTPDGQSLPPPVSGDFNLEVVTSPQGNSHPLPLG